MLLVVVVAVDVVVESLARILALHHHHNKGGRTGSRIYPKHSLAPIRITLCRNISLVLWI